MKAELQGTRRYVRKTLPVLKEAADCGTKLLFIRRAAILMASIILLCGTKARAQEGIGYVGDFSWQYQSWFGLGVGATLAPHTTLSMSGGLAWGFLSQGEPGFPASEWATAAAYRFKEKSPTMYIFAGYRSMAGNGGAKFVEAGMGYAPPDSFFEAYPELSILLPLTHRTSWLPGTMGSSPQPMRIPIILKLTIKLYFDPSIAPFWENSGNK